MMMILVDWHSVNHPLAPPPHPAHPPHTNLYLFRSFVPHAVHFPSNLCKIDILKLAEASRETATAVGHSVDNILCTYTHDDGYYWDEYVPEPNYSGMSDPEEEVAVEDEDDVEQDEDASDNEEQDESGVGKFSCVNVEGGSSANFPLRVFESHSELESD